MKVSILKLVCAVGLAVSVEAVQAASCRTVNWREGGIITVSSAMHLGTRIQFPADLVINPVSSNNDLWDASGAANALIVKPNSVDSPEGASVMLRVFTVDGASYDVLVNRVATNRNEACVIVKSSDVFFSNSSRSALQNLSQSQARQGAGFAQANAELVQQMAQERQAASDNARIAVMEALSKYRYHIYTRYQWDQGKGFSAQNLVSDVYDDGRFTYIRLHSANRGLLSVESIIGEQNAVVPAKYNEAYGMYQINGIYPAFTLRVDDAKISVSRADNQTVGK